MTNSHAGQIFTTNDAPETVLLSPWLVSITQLWYPCHILGRTLARGLGFGQRTGAGNVGLRYASCFAVKTERSWQSPVLRLRVVTCAALSSIWDVWHKCFVDPSRLVLLVSSCSFLSSSVPTLSRCGHNALKLSLSAAFDRHRTRGV